MTEILRPHEAITRGLMLDGETEDDAHRLARTALGSLVAAGYVLKIRGGDVLNVSESGETDQ